VSGVALTGRASRSTSSWGFFVAFTLVEFQLNQIFYEGLALLGLVNRRV
jgi:hypothetical protein